MKKKKKFNLGGNVTVSALPTIAQHAYTHAPASTYSFFPSHALPLRAVACTTAIPTHTTSEAGESPTIEHMYALYSVRPLLSPYYAALSTDV